MDRLTFLLLLLWVGVTVSTEVELQKRVYNGRNCTHGEHLYHVGLSNDAAGDDIHCGGSLIHPQWVLTAAHCCDSMYAVVGVHPGSRRDVMIILEKRIHKNHDIMLLKLENVVTGINPVPLPNNNDCRTQPQPNEPVHVAGLGDYQINTTTRISIPGQPAHLQCATMHVSHCNMTRIRNYRPFEPRENWICFEEPNVSTCPGDSGGGVIYNNKLRAVIVGGPTQICTRHDDSLDVCKYRTWIKKKTKVSFWKQIFGCC